MLKSKVVFVLVFFSLFFTISHDLVLAKHFNNDYSTTLEGHDELTQNHISSNDLIDLHEIFHFSAILYDLLNIKSLRTFYTKLNFTTLIPPTFISQSSFRPPIA
ncbi:MAG: Unknown protein [uncultured Sulfurovum sp.]|uniref:Uncharacterized protein n=1 Tax=uncultured Sulfurovum sp. TaxID=269237 RepID=A0A6S6SIN3_9BACT|nr:MAG: Unknown protein [uncultured Sulfurovum sp.]